MYYFENQLPNKNMNGNKISKLFIKGFTQRCAYTAEKEYAKLKDEVGKEEAKKYWSGWHYGKSKRSGLENIKFPIKLFNEQLHNSKVIEIDMHSYVKGYFNMPLMIQRAFSDMRYRRMLVNYPDGNIEIELYDRCNRKPSIGVILPLDEQDANEGFIAYRLIKDNRAKTKAIVKNKEKNLKTKKYEVAGKINVLAAS
jgi:hypothetical protein